MISIPRSILSKFRSLIRKAGLYKRAVGYTPGVAIVADRDGCLIRCASPQVAIQFQLAGSFTVGSLGLPPEALDAAEGKGDDTVTVEQGGKGRTLLTWTDRGVPRQASFDVPKPTTFPEVPAEFTTNESGLWSALRDAVLVTDPESTRYALGCLHLRGSAGRIEATDGRHVLTQSGFRFPWADDVLLCQRARYNAAKSSLVTCCGSSKVVTTTMTLVRNPRWATRIRASRTVTNSGNDR